MHIIRCNTKLPDPITVLIEAILLLACRINQLCTVALAASFQNVEHSKDPLSEQFQLMDRFRIKCPDNSNLLTSLRNQLPRQFQFTDSTRMFRQFKLIDKVPDRNQLSGQFQLVDSLRNHVSGQFQLSEGIRHQLVTQFQLIVSEKKLFGQFQL